MGCEFAAMATCPACIVKPAMPDLASRSSGASCWTFVLSSGYYDAYYLKAQKVRTLIKQDFEKAFEKVDVIISPTSPTPPFRIGEKSNDPLAMYLSDIFTITANLHVVPGIWIPDGT